VRGINRLPSSKGSTFPVLEAAFDYLVRTPIIRVAGVAYPGGDSSASTDSVATHR
jgi:hypothetical protein